MEKIIVNWGDTSKIAKQFNVSEQAVRSALRFISSGERPDQIREVAIKEYGGQLVKFPKRVIKKK